MLYIKQQKSHSSPFLDKWFCLIGTGTDFIDEMLSQEDGNHRVSDFPCHPLQKARKSSTPVPDDRLDEVRSISLLLSFANQVTTMSNDWSRIK